MFSPAGGLGPPADRPAAAPAGSKGSLTQLRTPLVPFRSPRQLDIDDGTMGTIPFAAPASASSAGDWDTLATDRGAGALAPANGNPEDDGLPTPATRQQWVQGQRVQRPQPRTPARIERMPTRPSLLSAP